MSGPSGPIGPPGERGPELPRRKREELLRDVLERAPERKPGLSPKARRRFPVFVLVLSVAYAVTVWWLLR